MGRLKIFIPHDDLERLYVQEKKSPIAIAKLYCCDPITVRTRIREYNIPERSQSAARMRYSKYSFSGDSAEKAYMIGFRLGDLNVYQTSQKSELIVVRCNTTQQVQIDVIQSLFGQYGRVSQSQGVLSTNINCYLNRTFDFLLPKGNGVPEWIIKDTRAAAAFAAGYVDAEGSFFLNQGRARFKLDSYDYEILVWITDYLNNHGIIAKLRRIGVKRDVRPDGTRYNHDLWRLNVNEAVSLSQFTNLIKPFVRHATRLAQIEICEDNLRHRKQGNRS